MKRIVLLLAVMLLAVPSQWASAQEKGKKDWQDRWKAEKIAYLTDAMDLTSAEAEKFWPVYNRCEAEKKKCYLATLVAYNALNEAVESGKGDGEIKTLLGKYIESQDCGKDIDSKYIVEYQKILPNKKVAKLFIAEETFRRQQIHRLHKNDKNNNR